MDRDGPGGLTRRNYLADPKDESTATGTVALGYNSSVVIASTWSQDMAFQRGASVGEDGLWTNTEGWWGPGGNTHRTPYSGRNFEYYSEDAYLGGMIGANDVAGGLSKGLRSFFKHFAANDQETNRHGLSTFANEQALREIYFKQFQHVIQTGKAITLMESFNRIGCTWAGGCYALCTQLLRDEWGFEGNVETDLNFTDPEGWMNPRTGLAGGTDQWLMIGESNLGDYVKDDLGLAYEIRQASHRILYAASKTAAMNGMDESSTIVPVKAWWEITLYALDIVSALAVAACLAGLLLLERKERTALGSKPGVGFYLGCAGAVMAAVAVVGCAILGGMTPEILLLVLGIALFGAAVVLKQQMLVLLSCFCYVGAGCTFLTHQLYTVTNVIAGIDATSFEGKFLVALVGVAAAILLGIAASIPALQKAQEA